MANSNVVKSAANYIPYCKDQGMPNLVATVKPGVGLYSYTENAPSSGAMTLPHAMANATYQIFIIDNAREKAIYATTKTANTFVPVGATSGDTLDIFVIGTLKDQLV